MIVTGHIDKLKARFRQRGKPFSEECIISREGDMVTVDTDNPAYPRPGPPGPGQHLQSMLHLIGIHAVPGCKCNAMARNMDRMGPDWCEGPGMVKILKTMRNEHKRRGMIIPWSDTVAKGLVYAACALARRGNSR
jgi:hypothetical protein